MKSLHMFYALAAISMAATLGLFGIIDLAPSTLRFTSIAQSAAVGAAATIGTTLPAATSSIADTMPPGVAFPQGIISINFDDGWKSGYTTGFPILEAAGLPATFYIISGALQGGAYMTVPDMLALQSAGEEIGDHTKTHPDLTKLTSAQMQDEIAGSMQDLKADGVQSITTFAYPYGANDAATDAIVKEAGYAAARTVDDGLDSSDSDPYHLQSREVMSNTTVAEVEAWIDTAVARKQWLILVFHQLNPAYLPHDPYSWATPNFQAIVDYLSANHIPVMTNAAVIKHYFVH